MKQIKKRFALLITVLMVVALLIPSVSFAWGASGAPLARVDGVRYRFEADETNGTATITLIAIQPGSTLPDGVMTIPSVFRAADIVQEECAAFKLQDYTVTKIGTGDLVAAALKDSLKKIIFPDTVSEIGKNAFRDLPKLTEVSIGSGVTTVGANVFLDCTALTSVSLPNVEVIPDWMCGRCTSLGEINIPKARTIGASAFLNCSELAALKFPGTVTSIGQQAFDGCTGVESITWEKGTEPLSLSVAALRLGGAAGPSINLPSLSVPERVNEMTESSFQWITTPTLSVLSSAASGKDWPLEGCKGTVTDLTVGGNVTTIEGGTNNYSEFSQLDTLSIGEGVETIADTAFDDCSQISSLSLPLSLKSISAESFTNTSVSNVSYAGSVAQWDVVAKKGLPEALQRKSVICEGGTWPSVTSITLNESSLDMTVGSAAQKLTATVTQYGMNDSPAWTSSDESVATVGQDGTVTAVGSGNATITVTAGDKSATCAVTVTNPATSITVSSTAKTITAGETFQLSAATTPANADGSIVWASSNMAVASVTQEGLVKGLAAGNATITAKVGTKEATCEVNVLPAASAITIGSGTLDVTVGEDKKVTLAVEPTGAAAPSEVTWSSSSDAVATVVGSTTGATVSGIASGSATITATASFGSKTLTGTCTVNVTNPAKSIALSNSSLEIVKGKSTTITATTDPVNADGTVTWTSSDAGVATVTGSDRTATINALKDGKTTITAAAASGQKATCTVTVTQVTEPAGITLSPEVLIVEANKTCAVGVTLNPLGANGTIEKVTWTSDKTSVATVTGTSETAQITGKTAGTAVITAKATVSCAAWDAPKAFEQTCTVTVTAPELTGINVTPASATVKLGGTQELSAALVPAGAQGEITWTSANEAIATVEGSGTSATVKALKTGTVKITASSGAVTGECTVTVSTTAPAAQKPTGITLNPKTTAVEKGKSVRIEASLTPSGSSGNITWTSSDEKTASVSADGTVTGAAAGKAVITASVQGTALSASCSVTVTDPNGSPSASASASATAGSSSSAGAPPLPAAPGTSPGISGAPAAQPSAGPNPSQSAAPGTSEPSADASASAKPSAVVTPAPDTPPVELKPDITDAPAPIEIVTDPDSGGSILTGVPISSPSEKTDVADVASWIDAPEGASVAVRQIDGQPAPPDAAIATGMCIEVTSPDGTVLQSTTVVVKGDVTGTGEMNLTQLVRMARGYTGTDPLRGVFLAAADLNGDGRVTLTDLVREARMFVAAGL